MRVVLGLLLITVAGAVAGVGLALVHVRAFDHPARDDGQWSYLVEATFDDPRLPSLSPTDGPQPSAVVDPSRFRFGPMDTNAEGSHTFTIANRGDAPLMIRAGDTSCTCTLSELTESEVPPGGSTTVTLKWQSKHVPGKFRQSATILTNDRAHRRLTLWIEGEVRLPIAMEPPDVVFTNIDPARSHTAAVLVHTAKYERLAIVGHKATIQETADYFTLTTAPAPADRLPAGAKSGVLVMIATRPGLPRDSRQDFVLTTNVPDQPPLELKVEWTLRR